MEDPNFIFSSGPIQLKEEGENFFVEGHISTSDLDLVNDIVTKDCIMDMAEQMKERTIKLDVEHESFKGNTDLEREINKTIIPAAKIDDFLVDKKGLKVRAMLNRHIGRFNEVKDSIKDGFLDAFSIAFIPLKSTTQIREGSEVRMLDKINLLNVAFTGNPVNTHSTMTNVFAKSLEFLEEKKRGPGGHKPDKTGPHGRGVGPGGGRVDGSGVDEEEEDEDEEKKKKKKEEKSDEELKKKHSKKWHSCVEKVRKMGGVRSPEAVCTEALGEESYKSLDNDHISDNAIKLKEVKNMTEDKEEEKPSESEEKPDEGQTNSEESESEEKEESKEEVKDEPGEKEEDAEESKEESKEESAEEKESSTEEEVKNLKKDMMEVKAALKRPMLKSRVEQKDKSKEFAEEKSLNPLDVIA